MAKFKINLKSIGLARNIIERDDEKIIEDRYYIISFENV